MSLEKLLLLKWNPEALRAVNWKIGKDRRMECREVQVREYHPCPEMKGVAVKWLRSI